MGRLALANAAWRTFIEVAAAFDELPRAGEGRAGVDACFAWAAREWTRGQGVGEACGGEGYSTG